MSCLSRTFFFELWLKKFKSFLAYVQSCRWHARLADDTWLCSLWLKGFRVINLTLSQCYLQKSRLFVYIKLSTIWLSLLGLSPSYQKRVAKTDHLVTMFGKLAKRGMISRCTLWHFCSLLVLPALFSLYLFLYPASQTNPSAGIADSSLWHQWHTLSYQQGS